MTDVIDYLSDLHLQEGIEFLVVNIADACFGILQLAVLVPYFKSWIKLGKLKMMDVFTSLTFSCLTLAILIRCVGSFFKCFINFRLQLSIDTSWD